jgi:hypothetical protein
MMFSIAVRQRACRIDSAMPATAPQAGCSV